MAVSTDPTVLANNARCYDSCIPDGMQMSVLISLFAQIANVSVDTNSLMNNAKCIDSCVPRGMQLPVLIYLATQIANNGGGGGGGGNVLLGDPTAGATINGGVAYDALGNVWGDFDPAGVHDWQKLISAQAAMKVIAAAQRNEPMIVTAPELPASPDMPPVKLPPSRRSKVFAFLHTIKMFLMSFFALLMLFVPFTAIAAAPPIVHSPLTEKFATGVPIAGDSPIFNADNTWHFGAGGSGITSLNGAITGTGPGATTTLLGSFTALQLFNAVATKTGTGNPVFASSPTIQTLLTINGDVVASGSLAFDNLNIVSDGVGNLQTVSIVTGDVNVFNLTANRAVVTDGSRNLASSATTAAQIGFLSTVTSDIQVQLDSKQASGNYITGLTSDVIATGPGSAVATLKNTGTAGTYRSVTFDAQGRETSGSNPTTFSGYAISDTSANLATAITDESGSGVLPFFLLTSLTSGDYVRWNGSAWVNVTAAASGFIPNTPGGAGTNTVFRSSSANSNTITIIGDNVGTTATNGLMLTNSAVAAAGAQQYSPATIWAGNGWKTTATAASQPVEFRAYTVPVQGSTAPTATWNLDFSVNNGAFGNPPLQVSSIGAITLGAGSAAAYAASRIGLQGGGGLESASSGAVIQLASGGGASGDIILTGGSSGTSKGIQLMPASGGKVGVNTASPAAMLHVSGSLAAQAYTVSKTANYTLVALDSGTYVNNVGALTATTNTLATATANYQFGGINYTNLGFWFQTAATTEFIYYGGWSGTNIGTTDTNASIHMVSRGANNWTVDYLTGVWFGLTNNANVGMAGSIPAPTAITFPATTVNWTNTFRVPIQLYVDNTGTTGTVIKKNGGTIFTTLPLVATITFYPGEYFSETYSIGTPSATWSPMQ